MFSSSPKKRSLVVVLMVSVLVLLAGCTTAPSGDVSTASGEPVQTEQAAPGQQSADLPEQIADMTAAMERMKDGDMPAAEAMAQMMGMMAQMMTQMQGMMGVGMMGATGTMTGTMPITGTMPMGDMGQMMGMMAQMMTQMQGMMGAGMMGATGTMTGTMPITGTMPMGDMSQMMGMMAQMMTQMQGMMGAGMGQMGAASPMSNQPNAMTDRQAEVAERGAQVMPFDLEQTIHVFKMLDNGGLQQVLVKDGADVSQVPVIQMHLTEEAERFRQGDFGDPAQIHGEDMPGLAVLRQRAREVDVRYTALYNGAQLEYISDDPELVTAIHDWFGAQLADHGVHATEYVPMGDMSQMMGMMAQMMTMMSQMQGTMGAVLAPEAGAPTQDLTQMAEMGAITVKVTPIDLTGQDGTLDFTVVFDTHSVELDFDFSKVFVLQVGDREIVSAGWESAESSGHHVSGTVKFSAIDPNGESLLAGATQASLAVRIPNHEETLSFTWDLNR